MSETMTAMPVAAAGNDSDGDYHAFLSRVNARFLANAKDNALFTTDADHLWDLYLGSFETAEQRQHHNCHACRQFIQRFGGLATIDDRGLVESAVWHKDDANALYLPALADMCRAVRAAKITGVFLASDRIWGQPETGAWSHLALRPLPGMLFKRTILSSGQAMAAKREDFKTVMHALDEFTQPHLETALTLLRSDALYRSEKVLGQAEWLYNLHVARRASAYGFRKANIVWRAIATAPAGFCHPRSSMIGTLLDDIAAGKDYNDVARAFAAKMHPLQYQRPQAAPSAGAIAAAEKVVQQLGAAGSLERRFCRLDEVQALWRPVPVRVEQGSGVFDHLTPKGPAAPTMQIPPQTMTWEKFRREVLPTAERLEFLAPARGQYSALVTAVHPDAPPILQWDHEDARNPVSWYFWNGGSVAEQFHLTGGRFVAVEAITLKPSMWNGLNKHHGDGVMFILAGARESRCAGAALFPEILRAEFHGVRSVIEAYSKAATIQGMDKPHAAGILLDKSAPTWRSAVRVWRGSSRLDYVLDRWD